MKLLLEAASPVFAYIFAGVVLAALAAFAVWKLVKRFVLDSNRREKTVRARFVGRSDVALSHGAADRARVGKENAGMGLEASTLVFRDEQSGRELRFAVKPGDARGWAADAVGELVYCGGRFVSFVTE